MDGELQIGDHEDDMTMGLMIALFFGSEGHGLRAFVISLWYGQVRMRFPRY